MLTRSGRVVADGQLERSDLGPHACPRPRCWDRCRPGSGEEGHRRCGRRCGGAGAGARARVWPPPPGAARQRRRTARSRRRASPTRRAARAPPGGRGWPARPATARPVGNAVRARRRPAGIADAAAHLQDGRELDQPAAVHEVVQPPAADPLLRVLLEPAEPVAQRRHPVGPRVSQHRAAVLHVVVERALDEGDLAQDPRDQPDPVIVEVGELARRERAARSRAPRA